MSNIQSPTSNDQQPKTILADLHLHSRFSRACSKQLNLPNLRAWSQLKGLDLIATADFTHPEWFAELQTQLTESKTAPGLYELQQKFANAATVTVPLSCQNRKVHFIFSTEISLIYKKGERCRKIHYVILAPSLQAAAKLNQALDQRGNLHADGRPILGLTSEELLTIILQISPDFELIPAHVWTPHFAIFGSKSGFDSVEECFGDLSPHIHALETGLSSDPPMNWQIQKNDQYVLVSSSDAHSLAKLGREATIFQTELSYPALLRALRSEHHKIATLEFFPEEGKYHADGLRAEKLCLTPAATKQANYVSPQTGKPITVGVLHRISNLADRQPGTQKPQANPYFSLIPLTEILTEILGVGPNSKKVQQRYFELISTLGPELLILKDVPLPTIEQTDSLLAEALKRMRASQVQIQPGYDGEYGVIRLFKPGEIASQGQLAFGF